MHRTILGRKCGHTQSGHSRDIPKTLLLREFAQCWHQWKDKFFLVLVYNRSLVVCINLVFFSFAFLCVFTSVLVHMHVCPRGSEVNLGCFFPQEPSISRVFCRTGSSQLLLGQWVPEILLLQPPGYAVLHLGAERSQHTLYWHSYVHSPYFGFF